MKYLILGGNAAGMSFAAKMKRNQPETQIVVIEKNDYVSFGACGLPYYVGNRFNSAEKMIIRTPEKFISQGIDLRLEEEAVEIDYDLKIVKVKKNNLSYDESYDHLIVTTGAQPIKLPIENDPGKNIFTLTSKNDGEEVKKYVEENSHKEIAILGAGFIGLELMDELSQTNHKLTVVTRTESILDGQYDLEMLQKVEEEIVQTPNIKLKLKKEIEAIKYNLETEKFEIKLTDEMLIVDSLVMALGFRPNTNFLTNIEKLPNGAIITNQKGLTSQKDVYALGDCATVYNKILNKAVYLPLATSANKLGKMLAEELSGEEPAFFGMLGSSCIKVAGYELGRTGLTKLQAIENGIDVKEKMIIDTNQTGYYPGQQQIWIKLYYRHDNLEIVGAEMLGKKGVVGRVGILALAIDQKLTTKQLAYLDLPYSPPFSKTWDPLNTVGNASK